VSSCITLILINLKILLNHLPNNTFFLITHRTKETVWLAEVAAVENVDVVASIIWIRGARKALGTALRSALAVALIETWSPRRKTKKNLQNGFVAVFRATTRRVY
jgi:hypothetical protein